MQTTYSHYAARKHTLYTEGLAALVIILLSGFYVLKGEDLTILDSASFMLNTLGRSLFGLSSELGFHAGGMALQILAPIVLIAFFLHQRYLFGIQVFLFWLGQNLVHLSVYFIRTGLEHGVDSELTRDWIYLVDRFGLSEYVVTFDHGTMLAGIVCFLLAVSIPFLREES